MDGYPRTKAQAETFDIILKQAGMQLDAVLMLNVNDQEVVERISGRRVCPHGHSYHLRYAPPQKEGICDIDSMPLEQRRDDTDAVIRQRLATFHESTLPVIEHYRQHHLFKEVNGIGSVDSVTA